MIFQTAIITLSSIIALVMEDYKSTDSEDISKLVEDLVKLSKNTSENEESEALPVMFDSYVG